MVRAIVALHVALGRGLMQVREVRDAGRGKSRRCFVSLVAPPAPQAGRAATPGARAQDRFRPGRSRVITAAPTPQTTTPAFTAPPPDPEPCRRAGTGTGRRRPGPACGGRAAPARELPASAVQYLKPPVLNYPALSRRPGESGACCCVSSSDEAGLPVCRLRVHDIERLRTLDGAALCRRSGKVRFKPYSENGRPGVRLGR
jgi:protein TonB